MGKSILYLYSLILRDVYRHKVVINSDGELQWLEQCCWANPFFIYIYIYIYIYRHKVVMMGSCRLSDMAGAMLLGKSILYLHRLMESILYLHGLMLTNGIHSLINNYRLMLRDYKEIFVDRSL